MPNLPATPTTGRRSFLDTVRFPGFRPLLLALLLVTMTGCEALDYRPYAVGREGEVVVVIDSTRWEGPVGEAIRRNIAPYLGTLPAPEREFNVRRVSLTSQRLLDGVQAQKNVIFVSPISDDTPESRFMRARLDSASVEAVLAGQSAVIPRRDLWRQQQQVVYVVAGSDDELIRVLDERGDDIRYQFNTITRERLTEDMFEKGRQFAMEDTLLANHGFTLNMQHDYFVGIDTTNFIWLRRVVSSESWRSLFVYYVDDFDPTNLTPEWIQQARDRLTETYIRGTMDGFVTTDYRRELTSENIDFKGRFAYETRGLWHMMGRQPDGSLVEHGMGGAFVNYTLYDEESGRLYMIDGMIFAPGFDKREFLRQMEVIAWTFRTERDVALAASRDAVSASF
ncbi:MAG: DUF4837 family protein [Rhodothermales bacterium]